MGDIYLIIFDKNNRQEKIPKFFGASNMECICEKTKKSVLFIAKTDVYIFENQVNDKINNFINLRDETVNKFVLIHNKRTFEDLIGSLEGSDNVKLILDYSAGDNSYEAMWRDISESKDCCELISKIEYWIKKYQIDPFNRIKHRIIDSFNSISTDLQLINELIEDRKYHEAEKALKNIISNWRAQAISPLRKLLECWDLLVELKNINGLPDEYKKEKDILNNNLYKAMKKIASEKDINNEAKWRDLLHHCQLEYIDNNFKLIVREGIGIYRFVNYLEDIIKHDYYVIYDNIFSVFHFQIFNRNYHEEILNEVEYQKLSEELKNFLRETRKFIIWVEELNDKIEALIEWIDRP